jgi:hypothetical protein
MFIGDVLGSLIILLIGSLGLRLYRQYVTQKR